MADGISLMVGFQAGEQPGLLEHLGELKRSASRTETDTAVSF
jgi:hypothetical protein